MKIFKDEVRRYFQHFLEGEGFSFIDLVDDYSGNIVVMKSDNLKIRFVNDRADFFIDIAKMSEPDTWIGFYDLLDSLRDSNKIALEYKHANKIEPVSKLLKGALSAIQEHLQQ
jgi:hypothetical protein